MKLNNHQRNLCRRHAGFARFAYNWGLQRKIEEYEKTGSSPTAFTLSRELNRLKLSEFSWMYELSSRVPQEAFKNLDFAFNQFFRRIKKGKKLGFPKFKARKCGLGSFRLNGVIRVSENVIQLPRLGRLRLKERGYLPSESNRIHILSATVSEKAGRWFVSLQVREEISPEQSSGPVVGVDVGLRHLAVLSDGTFFDNPKALSQKERKLKQVQRKLAKKLRGSNNYQKLKLKLQRIHKKIANIRKDAIHKITTRLVKTKSVIVIEGLNIRGLTKNHSIAKAVSDASFQEFRRQLEYKTVWYGSNLIIVPWSFPSSKRCSKCGKIKKELPLSSRIYECKYCGLTMDRDLNASKNLALVAASWSETINACLEVGGYRSIGSVPINDARTEHQSKNLKG